MRAALYQYLTTHCQAVKVWQQPYTATKDTPKPYGVIVIGERIRSLDNSRGSFRELYVWPYFGGSSFVPLDGAVREITRLLDGVTLITAATPPATGKRFTVEWADEGRDYRDPDLEALTRRITFRVPLVGVGL